ncbi:hypothetical protein DEO45_09875 [Rhodanobacter denitrificans]|uniref:Uncharacterized protein n=1 Tax=Rhodanobacter denitrificans TaxID=666685 RepID=A0A368KCC0_9GAMM|nr:hypothetical protein DEO45_09875 [Rhodanobacter denitrificans]
MDRLMREVRKLNAPGDGEIAEPCGECVRNDGEAFPPRWRGIAGSCLVQKRPCPWMYRFRHRL